MYYITATILLLVQTMQAVEFMTPTSGRFFYSDFWLSQSKGFHEMNIYDIKTE